MRNFDQMIPEDREFMLGGETFHWRPVHWRVYSQFIDTAVAEGVSQAEGAQENRPLEETFVDLVNRVQLFLVPEEKEHFLETVNDEEKAITASQLGELSTWLLEVQTERSPTASSSPSGNGLGTPGAISQGVS